jgi:hypothetical protein
MSVLPRESSESLEYSDTSDSVERVWSRLKDAEIVSVRLRPDTKSEAFAIIYSPQFNDHCHDYWYAAFECACGGRSPPLDPLLEPELDFVSISVEEGVELPQGRVTAATFPWEDWRLVVGAVRDEEGEWVIREGRKSW